MGSAGQRPLMVFAWHRPTASHTDTCFLSDYSVVCVLFLCGPMSARHRRACGRQFLLLPPPISHRRREDRGCSAIGRSPSTSHCFKF